MPELPLEQAEEALHRRVVRAAALGGHAPGEAMPLADRDPAGPAVVPAAVGVDDGALAGREQRAGVLERRVGERGVRALAGPPRHDRGVEAVPDGRQVDLPAGGQPELGDVGEPQEVRQGRAEVAPHEVRRGRRRLARVGAVGPPLPPHPPGDQALLAHDAADDLLRGADGLVELAEPAHHEAVAARAVAVLQEHAPHEGPQRRQAVRPGDRAPLVVIGAPRYPQESGEFSQGPLPRRPQAVYHQGLLPVRHPVEARGF